MNETNPSLHKSIFLHLFLFFGLNLFLHYSASPYLFGLYLSIIIFFSIFNAIFKSFDIEEIKDIIIISCKSLGIFVSIWVLIIIYLTIHYPKSIWLKDINDLKILFILLFFPFMGFFTSIIFFMLKMLKYSNQIYRLLKQVKKIQRTFFNGKKYVSSVNSYEEINSVEKIIISFKKILESKDKSDPLEENTIIHVTKKFSHEVKNPLTPIQLATEILHIKFYDQVENKELFSKYINTINNNVKTLSSILSRFIYFTNISQANKKKNNLSDIIRETIEIKSGLSNNIEYIYRCNNSDIPLYCDKMQMTQVLNNLIKNSEEAIKNNKDSIYTGCIKISLESRIDDIILVINDNGGGLHKKNLKEAMNEYYTTTSQGMGLGLSIVKKIISDHKGTINIINVHHGALVTVYLPKIENEHQNLSVI